MFFVVPGGLKNFWGEVDRPDGWEWSMGDLRELAVVATVGPGRGRGVHVLLLRSVNCGLPPAV